MNRGHGFYDNKAQKCRCFDKYEGLNCELKICEYGSSWSDDGETSVCSDRGTCNPSTGLCECFSGYGNDNCSISDCKNSCSGHGICVTDKEYCTDHVKKVTYDGGVYKISDSGITITKIMERRKQCICESGYSGSDCSTKECPYGALGTQTMKTGYYSDKKTPKDEISNNGNFGDVKVSIANCPSLPTTSKAITCRYEKISLTKTMTKDDIRQEIIKSGIVHDIAVELYTAITGDDIANTLEMAKRIVLYYILDPYAGVITDQSLTVTHTATTSSEYIPIFRECSGKDTCSDGICYPTTRATASSGVDPYIQKIYGLSIENGQTTTSDESICQSDSSIAYNCKCSTGYVGVDCHKECPKSTDGFECNNHGICDENGECKCDDGYGGKNNDKTNCSVNIIPIDSGDVDNLCSGNGVYDYVDGMCKCNYEYTGKCPNGPVQIDLRCEVVKGEAPSISFTFKVGSTYSASMNGKYSHKFTIVNTNDKDDINVDPSQIKTIGGFISFLKQYIGIQEEITIKDLNDKNNYKTPITTFTLSFYYYCNDELCPTKGSINDGLRIYDNNNKLLQSTITYSDSKSYNIDNADNGKLEYNGGTIKCDVCSGKGVCNAETGLCECFKQYSGSNGWNSDKTKIEAGSRGDCSYFSEVVIPI